MIYWELDLVGPWPDPAGLYILPGGFIRAAETLEKYNTT